MSLLLSQPLKPLAQISIAQISCLPLESASSPESIFVAVLLKSCLKNNRMEPMLQIDMQLYSDPVFNLLITISEHSQCVCVRSDLHFVSHLNYTNSCCGHQPLYATKPWAIRP